MPSGPVRKRVSGTKREGKAYARNLVVPYDPTPVEKVKKGDTEAFAEFSRYAAGTKSAEIQRPHMLMLFNDLVSVSRPPAGKTPAGWGTSNGTADQRKQKADELAAAEVWERRGATVAGTARIEVTHCDDPHGPHSFIETGGETVIDTANPLWSRTGGRDRIYLNEGANKLMAFIWEMWEDEVAAQVKQTERDNEYYLGRLRARNSELEKELAQLEADNERLQSQLTAAAGGDMDAMDVDTEIVDVDPEVEAILRNKGLVVFGRELTKMVQIHFFARDVNDSTEAVNTRVAAINTAGPERRTAARLARPGVEVPFTEPYRKREADANIFVHHIRFQQCLWMFEKPHDLEALFGSLRVDLYKQVVRNMFGKLVWPETPRFMVNVATSEGADIYTRPPGNPPDVGLDFDRWSVAQHMARQIRFIDKFVHIRSEIIRSVGNGLVHVWEKQATSRWLHGVAGEPETDASGRMILDCQGKPVRFVLQTPRQGEHQSHVSAWRRYTQEIDQARRRRRGVAADVTLDDMRRIEIERLEIVRYFEYDNRLPTPPPRDPRVEAPRPTVRWGPDQEKKLFWKKVWEDEIIGATQNPWKLSADIMIEPL
ncbi:hypothetical protein OQA88_5585 [Cercophora sp. LCS_1]